MKTTSPTTDAAELSERVARNVRVELARQGLKLTDFADATGIHMQAMWRRMSGAVAWNLEELAGVASVLRVDVRDLLAP